MKCTVQGAKSPVKYLVHTYIYIYVKFLALLRAPYIYDISRLRVNNACLIMNGTNMKLVPGIIHAS
jgi:hypothetical protein